MEYPEGLARNKYAAFRQEWRSKHPRGYHAWHSADMKDWKLLGLVCPSGCMTTAEYADGKFYLYYDNPNDENPHLIIDDDLTDGILGKEYGEVFTDPSHGSDAGVFRDEDGTFHMIYEDWSPINARENGWDSPLAGRVSSPDGIRGFTYGEHPPAVDHRTKPTGKIGTFTHPAMKISNNGKPLEYEIHEPSQNAYGDWTLIKVGSHYHLFGDYDSADHSKPMRMARFHTDDLNKEFQWSGEIGKGFHPDPSVGFAEGKFYLIMQRATDFVSPGPWVDGVEARAGVDEDGDGTIDEWTDWEGVKESYSQKPGFARIVDVAPAKVDTGKLPAGQGFAFEYRTSRLDNGVQPIMDRVSLEFDKPNGKEKKKVVARIGFLAEEVGQHPVIGPSAFLDESGKVIVKEIKQFYFNVGEKRGSNRQIIVTYPPDMKVPTIPGRKIELRGTLDSIDLGGEPGTKGSYGNDVLRLQSWKYL